MDECKPLGAGAGRVGAGAGRGGAGANQDMDGKDAPQVSMFILSYRMI